MELTKVEELMGILLENWNQRYAFKLDRETMILNINVPGLGISAQENEGGEIIVTLDYDEEEGLHSRVGGVEDSAVAIEGILFPDIQSSEISDTPN